MRRRTFVYLTAVLSAVSLAACTPGDTPEQRLRALIDGAEEAVENREGARLRGYISERYSDEQGRDRRTIDGILRLYVLRHDAIHLYTRVGNIRFPEPAQAEAVVYVAMAGRPITSAAEVAAFRANLYRFELGFADEDGEWRLVRAAWRRAELGDFVYQGEATPGQ